MRRKAKNAQKENKANSLPKSATMINKEKPAAETSTTQDKPSTSEPLTRRQTLSQANDGQKKTGTPFKNVTVAGPTSKRRTTSTENTTKTKKLTLPKKVVLAKKAIVAKKKEVAKKKKKNIVRKVTNLRIKLPIRVGKNKVCTLVLDFFWFILICHLWIKYDYI